MGHRAATIQKIGRTGKGCVQNTKFQGETLESDHLKGRYVRVIKMERKDNGL
jgi:hypothetical protein